MDIFVVRLVQLLKNLADFYLFREADGRFYWSFFRSWLLIVVAMLDEVLNALDCISFQDEGLCQRSWIAYLLMVGQ